MAAAVVETASLHLQRRRTHPTCRIAQGLSNGQGQRLLTQDLAAAVIQTVSLQREAGGAGDFSVAVIDAVEVVQQQLTGRADHAALVIQMTAIEVQAQTGLAGQTTTAIVQVAHTELACTGAAETTATVIQHARHTGVQRTATAHAAVLVIDQAGDIDLQAGSCNQSRTVIQGLRNLQGQPLVAEQLAGSVIDGTRRNGKGPRTGDFALAVVYAVEVVEGQLPGGIDQPAAVIQMALVEVEVQVGVAVKAAAPLLIKAAEIRVQALGTGDLACATVIDRTCRQVQGLAAGEHTALLVIQRTHLDLRTTGGLDPSLLLVGQGATQFNTQRALAGEHAILAVVQ